MVVLVLGYALVQASCTDLTLQGNWSPVTWTTDFDLREKVAIQNLLYLQFYCHFKPFYHLMIVTSQL